MKSISFNRVIAVWYAYNSFRPKASRLTQGYEISCKPHLYSLRVAGD